MPGLIYGVGFSGGSRPPHRIDGGQLREGLSTEIGVSLKFRVGLMIRGMYIPTTVVHVGQTIPTIDVPNQILI